MNYRKSFGVFIALSLLLLAACGPKAVAPKAALDTPEHHVSNGDKLLKAGKITDARQEFQRAKALDPKFSPAYAGLGLVHGLQNDFKTAFQLMKQADKYAKNKDQELSVLVGNMRLYIMGREQIDQKWLKQVEKYYKKATRKLRDHPAAYFYMGLAYKHAYAFDKARQALAKVIDINKEYVAAADKEYALIQKIERAMPGSSIGRKIALLEKISRADVAALFIQELHIDELFKKHAPKKFDTAFKSPQTESGSGPSPKSAAATDIAEHVLKIDIEAIIAIGIKGLQPYPDHKFRPENMVNRAEFAMMIEDIIALITRAEGLATQFIGNQSPFPDIRNDLPFFNAVMVCTTRGILQVKDAATGEFDPLGRVSGADALLSIRTLKTQL